MKKLLFVLFLLLPSFPAHAGRYWATVATVGSGKTPKDPHRAALSTLKTKGYTVTVTSKDEKTKLVVLIIDDKDLPLLKKVAAKVVGKEGDKVRFSAALKKKLRAEAKRLGAGDDWDPANYYVAE